MSRDITLPESIDGMTVYEILKANLLDIKDVFDKYKLDFWPIQGTFLGLYRDGDIIPYDNDVDVAIRREDYPKIEQAKVDLEKKGFKYIYGLWSCPEVAKHVAFVRHMATVDVFLFEKKGLHRVNRHISQIAAEAFEIYNELKYKGRKFRIFNNPEKWLSYFYGAWEIPVKGYHAFPKKE